MKKLNLSDQRFINKIYECYGEAVGRCTGKVEYLEQGEENAEEESEMNQETYDE